MSLSGFSAFSAPEAAGRRWRPAAPPAPEPAVQATVLGRASSSFEPLEPSALNRGRGRRLGRPFPRLFFTAPLAAAAAPTAAAADGASRHGVVSPRLSRFARPMLMSYTSMVSGMDLSQAPPPAPPPAAPSAGEVVGWDDGLYGWGSQKDAAAAAAAAGSGGAGSEYRYRDFGNPAPPPAAGAAGGAAAGAAGDAASLRAPFLLSAPPPEAPQYLYKASRRLGAGSGGGNASFRKSPWLTSPFTSEALEVSRFAAKLGQVASQRSAEASVRRGGASTGDASEAGVELRPLPPRAAAGETAKYLSVRQSGTGWSDAAAGAVGWGAAEPPPTPAAGGAGGGWRLKLTFGTLLLVAALTNYDHGAIPSAVLEIAADYSLSYIEQSLLGSLVYSGLIFGTLFIGVLNSVAEGPAAAGSGRPGGPAGDGSGRAGGRAGDAKRASGGSAAAAGGAGFAAAAASGGSAAAPPVAISALRRLQRAADQKTGLILCVFACSVLTFLFSLRLFKSLTLLYVFRFLTGAAQAFPAIFFPVWVDEHGLSGSWIAYLQLASILGTVLGYLAGGVLSSRGGVGPGGGSAAVAGAVSRAKRLFAVAAGPAPGAPRRLSAPLLRGAPPSTPLRTAYFRAVAFFGGHRWPLVFLLQAACFLPVGLALCLLPRECLNDRPEPAAGARPTATGGPPGLGAERLDGAPFGDKAREAAREARASGPAAAAGSWLHPVKLLLSDPLFLLLTLGMSNLYFVATGVQFWITQYMTDVLRYDRLTVVAATTFSFLTSPTTGVFMGGIISDRLRAAAAAAGGGGQRGRAAVPPAVLSAIALLAAGAAAAALVAGFARDILVVLPALWLSLCCGAAVVPLAISALMATVPLALRALASAISQIAYNTLGWFAAPLLSGVFMDCAAALGAPHVAALAVGFRAVLFSSGFGLLCFAAAALWPPPPPPEKPAPAAAPDRISFEYFAPISG